MCNPMTPMYIGRTIRVQVNDNNMTCAGNRIFQYDGLIYNGNILNGPSVKYYRNKGTCMRGGCGKYASIPSMNREPPDEEHEKRAV